MVFNNLQIFVIRDGGWQLFLNQFDVRSIHQNFSKQPLTNFLCHHSWICDLYRILLKLLCFWNVASNYSKACHVRNGNSRHWHNLFLASDDKWRISNKSLLILYCFGNKTCGGFNNYFPLLIPRSLLNQLYLTPAKIISVFESTQIYKKIGLWICYVVAATKVIFV